MTCEDALRIAAKPNTATTAEAAGTMRHYLACPACKVRIDEIAHRGKILMILNPELKQQVEAERDEIFAKIEADPEA